MLCSVRLNTLAALLLICVLLIKGAIALAASMPNGPLVPYQWRAINPEIYYMECSAGFNV